MHQTEYRMFRLLIDLRIYVDNDDRKETLSPQDPYCKQQNLMRIKESILIHTIPKICIPKQFSALPRKVKRKVEKEWRDACVTKNRRRL